jgi:UPF0176 protein
MCYGCRYPVSPEDRAHTAYEEGVSCPRCIGALTPARAESLRMRHKQLSKSDN